MNRREARAPKALPLLEWEVAQRIAVAERAFRKRLRNFTATGFLIGSLASTLTFPGPLFVWNASASAPIGLYVIKRSGGAPMPGDMVLARTPEPWRALAARRHYLPANVPLVKRAVAAEGDIVCAHDEMISINFRPAVTRRARDGAGRVLPWWEGCHVLRKGELFLLMAGASDSFDGRYFGVTRAPDVIGKARLIWAR